MEATFDSPGIGAADAAPLRRTARRRMTSVRISSVVITAYVLLHGALLFLESR